MDDLSLLSLLPNSAAARASPANALTRVPRPTFKRSRNVSVRCPQPVREIRVYAVPGFPKLTSDDSQL